MAKIQTKRYKKDIHDPDNPDGVIIHLEPDILECKVKWALGSITMNKAVGGDGIPVELFQILTGDVVKVPYMPGNLENSAVATGQLSNQSQRKAMPKNVQTTMQLHSSHMLTSNAQNSPSQAQQYMNCELPDVQAGFRKGRGTRDQIANIR